MDMSDHDSCSGWFRRCFTKRDTAAAAACVYMKPVSRCKKVWKRGHPPSSCGEHKSQREGTFAGDAVRDAPPRLTDGLRAVLSLHCSYSAANMFSVDERAAGWSNSTRGEHQRRSAEEVKQSIKRRGEHLSHACCCSLSECVCVCVSKTLQDVSHTTATTSLNEQFKLCTIAPPPLLPNIIYGLLSSLHAEGFLRFLVSFSAPGELMVPLRETCSDSPPVGTQGAAGSSCRRAAAPAVHHHHHHQHHHHHHHQYMFLLSLWCTTPICIHTCRIHTF